jgi:patatin-like phospholipase/acyl hydrolase
MHYCQADRILKDGGGVRGLSCIMILKHIMGRINEKQPAAEKLEPWQVFDMIGGTSTGG